MLAEIEDRETIGSQEGRQSETGSRLTRLVREQEGGPGSMLSGAYNHTHWGTQTKRVGTQCRVQRPALTGECSLW